MLSELEKNYFEAVSDANKHWQEVCRPIIQAIREKGGKAHAEINHEYKGDYDPWWLYDVDAIGIGFNWVKTPNHPINKELGQAYYTESQNSSDKNNLVYETWLIFEKELHKWLNANPPLKNGEVLKLKINNRLYWFGGLYDKYMQLYWKILHEPNGVITEKEI